MAQEAHEDVIELLSSEITCVPIELEEGIKHACCAFPYCTVRVFWVVGACFRAGPCACGVECVDRCCTEHKDAYACYKCVTRKRRALE